MKRYTIALLVGAAMTVYLGVCAGAQTPDSAAGVQLAVQQAAAQNGEVKAENDWGLPMGAEWPISAAVCRF